MPLVRVKPRSTFDSDLAVAIGNRIKKRRIEVGITQRAVAALAYMTDAQVSFIEQGKSVPTGTTILKLSEALKMSPNEILGWEE